jgi:hypothetical protein
MKKIKTFDLFESRNKYKKDFDKILTLLPHDIDIYKDIETLKTKKTREQSIIFNIIKNYYNYDNINDIMLMSMKFYTSRFNTIVAKYKKDVKKKNKPAIGNIQIIEIPIKGTDKTLKVPNRIGHGFTPIVVLPISELEKYKKHKRLKVFYKKGLQCVSCSVKGEYLIKARDAFGNIHIDVYSKDFKLMTVDHIKPKSKGGTYNINNLNPMCSLCNSKKGNTYEEENSDNL